MKNLAGEIELRRLSWELMVELFIMSGDYSPSLWANEWMMFKMFYSIEGGVQRVMEKLKLKAEG